MPTRPSLRPRQPSRPGRQQIPRNGSVFRSGAFRENLCRDRRDRKRLEAPHSAADRTGFPGTRSNSLSPGRPAAGRPDIRLVDATRIHSDLVSAARTFFRALSQSTSPFSPRKSEHDESRAVHSEQLSIWVGHQHITADAQTILFGQTASAEMAIPDF